MIIEARNIVKKYGNNTAVNSVNISVMEDEVLGFLGPNGAGKSTTLSCLLGLKKVDAGTIRVFGKDPKTARAEINRNIGYVPQDIAVFNELTAIDNVRFFGKLYGLRGKKLEVAVREALEFTGLWDRRKELPPTFSGGMKRRLNIACAIVHKPKLLIMDEPTVGVDPQSRNNILESIRKLNELGTTIIYTSHYMEEIQAICSRIIIIDMGEVIAEGTKDSIIQQAIKEKRVFIELDGDVQAAADSLSANPNILSITAEGNSIVITTDSGYNGMDFARELTEGGYIVNSIISEQPNLETAFLSLTGKKLRD